MLDGLITDWKAGDPIPATFLQEVARRVAAHMGGVNAIYSPHTGYAFRRHAGGGGLEAQTLRVMGFGTGKYGAARSSYVCKALDENGNPTGPNIEVLVRSYPNPLREDLTLCDPNFVPGDNISVVEMDFQVGADIISGLFAWDSAMNGCE